MFNAVSLSKHYFIFSGNVGGLMGVFMGASMITFIEFIIFFISFTKSYVGVSNYTILIIYLSFSIITRISGERTVDAMRGGGSKIEIISLTVSRISSHL